MSGNKEDEKSIKEDILTHSKSFKIDLKSYTWIYRHVPSLNRNEGINTEYDLYPVLQKILNDCFGILFDEDITGKPGQTDLFIESPFFCCCEVTPPNSNATGFNKVTEVWGHRRNMIHKNYKGIKGKEVAACVIGPSFTMEAGADKTGAIDLAENENIALISYKDIYELICLKDFVDVTIEDVKKLFFNKGEVSESISDLVINKLK